MCSSNARYGGGLSHSKSFSQRSGESGDSCISLISSTGSSPASTMRDFGDVLTNQDDRKHGGSSHVRPYSITSELCLLFYQISAQW